MISAEAAIRVEAPPDRVWALVADVTNMGRWSPITYRCEWTGGSTGPAPGATFRGYNRRGAFRWSRECVVTASVPGREFAFSTNYNGRESTRWRYTFAGADGGTEVTESYEAVHAPLYVRLSWLVPGMRAASERDGVRGMTETLRRVKEAAESA